MELSERLADRDLEFLTANHTAGMITIAPDGMPKVARVGVAVVDGKLWSSGTLDRTRTKRLRRDPRCTLYVTDPGFGWLALETTVTILEGADAPLHNVKLMRVMQGKPSGSLSWFGGELSEEDFLRTMVEEKRVVYEFDVSRGYGMH